MPQLSCLNKTFYDPTGVARRVPVCIVRESALHPIQGATRVHVCEGQIFPVTLKGKQSLTNGLTYFPLSGSSERPGTHGTDLSVP